MMDYVVENLPNLGDVKLSYQKEFLTHLDSISSPKAVYWEKILLAPVNVIVGHSSMKVVTQLPDKIPQSQEHGVHNSFLLENLGGSCSPPDCKAVIFVLSSNVKTVDMVDSFITRDMTFHKNAVKEYHIIAIPAFSYACKNFLSEKGSLKKMTSIFEFPLSLLPLDHDILSMEYPDCFANYGLVQKQQVIYQFVQGLLRFQSLFGLFPKILAKGNKATEVARMLVRLRQEAEVSLQNKPDRAPFNEVESQTNMLIILDRSVDCLTPLLSQLTYEGLISDQWGIRHGVCRFDEQTKISTTDQRKRITLNAGDELYSELRDQNFTTVGPLIQKRSKEISDLLSETKNATQLPDIKRVVTQLPELRSSRALLETHTSIAERIHKRINTDEFMLSLSAQQDFLHGIETDKAHPYIENCLLRAAPIEEVLRLICIQSFCNGGLKQRLLEYYKRELLQVYGFEHMFTLDNLDRIGLFYDSSTKLGDGILPRISVTSDSTGRAASATIRHTVTAVSSIFGTSLKRSLRLIVPPSQSPNSADPDQLIASVYSGYIPISVRLIQALCSGWLPNTVSSTAGQITSTVPSSVMSITASALLAGRGLIAGLRSDDVVEGIPTRATASPPLSNNNLTTTSSQTRSSHGVTSLPNDGANFVANLIPGVLHEEVQLPESAGQFHGRTKRQDYSNRSKPRVIAVAFVGGATHAEISALRSLAATSDANLEFVFITTGFVNHHTFLSSLSHDIQPAQLLPF